MEKIVRSACRAILLTPENEVLLIYIENPAGNWKGWITPGGGIEPGESDEQALRRELKEELGFVDFEIADAVWQRTHQFPWNKKIVEQSEKFYLIRTEKFKPKPTIDISKSEMIELKKFRWWKLAELLETKEVLSPKNFAELVKSLIENGMPPRPIEVGG
jgi:8-oxo-dGTP pyrophosphatase MutT (NUDIX family)